jgi:hypothetical protein
VKQGDPLSRPEFSRRVAALASAFPRAVGADERRAERLLQERIAVHVAEFGAGERARLEAAVREIVADVPSGARRALLSAIEEPSVRMERDARRASVARFRLTAPTALGTPAVAAALRRGVVASQFIPEHFRQRGQSAGASAYNRIAAGLERGEDPAAVAAASADVAAMRMRDTAGWRQVASATLARARSGSMLDTFRDGGVRSYQIHAVRDVDTCDKCWFMHGHTFDVPVGVRALAHTSATRVAALAPFLSEGVDDEGHRAVFAPIQGGRKRLAIVQESGSGRFGAAAPDADLVALGIVAPPFHPGCRCEPVPA